MSDLVKRLRKQVKFMCEAWGGDLEDPDQDGLRLWHDAANEIVRLQESDAANFRAFESASSEVEQLQAIVDQLRDERDVLALNFMAKDTGVVIAWGCDGEVAGVGWSIPTGAGNRTKLPKRLMDREERTETEDLK